MRRDLAHRQRHAGHRHELAAALVHVAVRVEALGALAHDHQVHRPAEAGAAARRAHIGIEVELHAERCRHVDPALVGRRIVEVRDRSEDDAVQLARSLKDALRQCRALALERRETHVLLLILQTQLELSAGRFENRERGRGDLGPDAVAGKDEEFHQSSLIPAALMMRAYLSSSARTEAANSSGELPTGSVASCLKRARISGSLRIATSSALSRRTMSGGVPAGACIEYHALVSYCGRPASAKVGRSGSSGERRGAEIASARSFPERTCGIADAAVSSIACTRPAMRSTSAGPPPL